MDSRLIEEKVQVLETDNVEVSRLHNALGQDAQIQTVENGYFIQTTLKEGFVEGGQEVIIELGARQEMPMSTEIFEGTGCAKFTGLPIISLRANGVELREGYNMYLATAGESPNSQAMQLGIANFADPGTKSIGIAQIKLGDDFATVEHEKGHTEDPDLSLEFVTRSKKLTAVAQKHYAPDSGGFDSKLTRDDKALELWKHEVERERFASQWAVERIKSRGAKANLFPGDHGLLRVKKYFTSILLQSHFQNFGGIFAKAIGNQKVKETLFY